MKTKKQIREQIRPLTETERKEYNLKDNTNYFIYVYSISETDKAGINYILSDSYKNLVNTVFESLN